MRVKTTKERTSVNSMKRKLKSISKEEQKVEQQQAVPKLLEIRKMELLQLETKKREETIKKETNEVCLKMHVNLMFS